jgi:hypothetical protein
VALVDLDRAVSTDSAGRYLLLDVPPGPQHVVVTRVGYASRTFHALAPRAGTLEIDVALRPEPIRLPPIEVRSPLAIRGLEGGSRAAFPDRGLSLAAVRNHPLLSEPDVLEAAGGGEVVLRPETHDGIHVRGGASDQVAYVLDGIPVLSPYHAGGLFSAWNPDALKSIDLLGASPAPSLPDALSGVVAGTTRMPGDRLETQGSVSTTQSRLTFSGPLGTDDAGYLVSARAGFPGLLGGKRESSHVRGNSGDGVGKLVTPIFGGRLSLLGYGTTTEIEVAARQGDSAATARPRNELEWKSRSLGAGWTRPLRGGSLEIRAWSVGGDAAALWGADSLPEQLAARRRDLGLMAMVELGRPGHRTSLGLRAQNSETSYRFRSDSGGAGLELSARTPVSAAFAEIQRAITARVALQLSLSAAAAAGGMHADPGARVEWKPSDAVTVSCGCARRHQYAQSLRNPESVVGNVLPVDLYVGADGTRVPVARSDLGVVAVEHRPASGIRLGLQTYARSFRSLLLVAPLNGGPFATSGFTTGSGDARGATLQLGISAARYGILADYGVQRVRMEYAGSSYVPEYGATHSIDAGVIVFPTATSSVRLGASSMLGRRSTAVLGPFEWEACNLLDRGCEFSGSPVTSGPLGDTRLPAYVRVDLGVRIHHHLHLAGRDVQLAAFGGMTNLLGRRNVLAVSVDPATGERRAIEMRPRSPLVLGIDWRF